MNTEYISFGGLWFHPFVEQDIDIMTPIMKRAFDHDTKIHTGRSEFGPEGYDNGDLFRQWYFHKDVTAFKISKDGRSIGAIALWINENNINYLGNIFIDPKLQDKGLGKIIWDYIEQAYPDTIKWQTDTIWFSTRNHHYYVNKCGFKIVKIWYPKNTNFENKDEICRYFMEKEMGVC